MNKATLSFALAFGACSGLALAQSGGGSTGNTAGAGQAPGNPGATAPPATTPGGTQPTTPAQPGTPGTTPATPSAPGAVAGTASFGQLDVNGDGTLSLDEVGTQADVTARFMQLDADRNGTLSTGEFAAFQSGTAAPDAAQGTVPGTAAPTRVTPPPGPTGMTGVQGAPSGGTTGDGRGARDTSGRPR